MCGPLTSTQCQMMIEGIYQAADQLNAIPYNPNGGNVRFCQRFGDKTAYIGRAPFCPTHAPDDDYTVTIRVVDGETSSSHECIVANAIACMAPKNDTKRIGEQQEPVRDRTMYILQPAYLYGQRNDGTGVLVVWTNNPDEHYKATYDDNDEVETRKVYVQTVIKNEFGHGAGADDTGHLDQGLYGKCVMSHSPDNIEEKHIEATDCDAEYFNRIQSQNS